MAKRRNGLGWLKARLPHGLYSRAALILFLPVIMLQAALTADFTQRYFLDVTRQLTANTAIILNYAIERVNVANDPVEIEAVLSALEALGIRAELASSTVSDDPASDIGRAFIDISGIAIDDQLRQNLTTPFGYSLWLGKPGRVLIETKTDNGLLKMDLPRRRFSPVAPHQLLVGTLVVALILVFVAAIFLRNQLRPIARLARVAEAFGRGRRTHYQVSGASEVRAAGRAFLKMRDRIERQNEQRILMLSGISHDLRTPITRLRLDLAMLDENQALPAQRDLDEMERMIDGFLSFARSEAEELALQSMSLGALIESIQDDAARSGQPVRYRLPPRPKDWPKMVQVDPLSIRRAIGNLIGNASRYGNEVVLSLRLDQENGFLGIAVEDDGPGIPEQDRLRALEAFERLDPSRRLDENSGSGLGLAIASNSARKHGGWLQLKSSERMGGLEAIFWFEKR